eukprot:gene12559-3254_t
MRKSTKAVLRNHLLGTENAIIPTTNDVCVVDGDALLHKVHWPKSTYSEIKRERFVAVQSNGDADISIVKTALEYAETGRCVVVMAEDMDILVSQEKHLHLCCLNPQDWGWKMEDGIMTPIKTDLDPAPEWLLQVVRCKCKMNTRHPCGTLSCSCRKNGLTCVTACRSCHREDC